MNRVSVVAPWSGSTAHLLPDFSAVADGFDEVVVVDDASDTETAVALRGAQATRRGWSLLRHDVRRGFAASCNDGYARSTGDVVAFLNSDVASPGAQGKFAGRVRAHCTEDRALYGPQVASQVVYGMGFSYLDGWCVAALRSTWDALVMPGNAGPWDAAAYPGPYWEDADLSLRAHVAGIHVVECAGWVTGGSVHHKGGGTTGPSLCYGESFERNRATFAARARPLWEGALREVNK